jgi:Na+/proline symporter
VPLVLGTYWKKSTAAAVAPIVVGSTLRMILYFIITIASSGSPYANYAGLGTIIKLPIVSLAVFVKVSLATQIRSPPRQNVVYLIPIDMRLVKKKVTSTVSTVSK